MRLDRTVLSVLALYLRRLEPRTHRSLALLGQFQASGDLHLHRYTMRIRFSNPLLTFLSMVTLEFKCMTSSHRLHNESLDLAPRMSSSMIVRQDALLKIVASNETQINRSKLTEGNRCPFSHDVPSVILWLGVTPLSHESYVLRASKSTLFLV